VDEAGSVGEVSATAMPGTVATIAAVLTASVPADKRATRRAALGGMCNMGERSSGHGSDHQQ
jgi:hypothetical protein